MKICRIVTPVLVAAYVLSSAGCVQIGSISYHDLTIEVRQTDTGDPVAETRIATRYHFVDCYFLPLRKAPRSEVAQTDSEGRANLVVAKFSGGSHVKVGEVEERFTLDLKNRRFKTWESPFQIRVIEAPLSLRERWKLRINKE